MGCMASNRNNQEDTLSRCLPTVAEEMGPVKKTGTWLSNNGGTTVVINRKMVAMCISSNSINHPNAVVGTVVASVAEVAVAGVEED